ncbi:MAG: hypothetical protein ACQEWV_33420 [Bacillota bacterium]
MKEKFIRMIFGLLIIGIIFGIGDVFNIDWLHGENNIGLLLTLSIAYIGSWGIWYLYKEIKKEKK